MNHLPARIMDQLAVISPCERYRYWLQREFGMFGKPVCFIMLNPSTADATQNDPTIRRCIGYAKPWGGSSLIVVNLFALRATDLAQLKADDIADPIGPDNDDAIETAVDFCIAHDGLAVVGWGNHRAYMDRGRDVLEGLWQKALTVHYLKMTGAGQPSHPLYLKADLQPTEWKPSR